MTTTTNVLLSTPGHGSNVNTWDADPVNNNSTVIDSLFGSVTSKALSNAPVSLTATEAQVSVLRFSGALSGNVAVNVGAIRKAWIVENTTTGNFVVTLTGGGGNVIGLPPGSCQAYWDGTNMSFINLGWVGQYVDYPSTTYPAWVTACSIWPYLLCDGSAFSSGTYPLLAAILGGTTLPDARGRSRIALDGGTGRVTSAGSGVDGATRFAAGGAQNIALTTAQLATHSHGVNDPTHTHTSPGIGFLTQTAPSPTYTNTGFGGNWSISPTTAASGTGISIQNNGNGDAHNNMQPTFVGGVTLIRAA